MGRRAVHPVAVPLDSPAIARRAALRSPLTVTIATALCLSTCTAQTDRILDGVRVRMPDGQQWATDRLRFIAGTGWAVTPVRELHAPQQGGRLWAIETAFIDLDGDNQLDPLTEPTAPCREGICAFDSPEIHVQRVHVRGEGATRVIVKMFDSPDHHFSPEMVCLGSLCKSREKDSVALLFEPCDLEVANFDQGARLVVPGAGAFELASPPQIEVHVTYETTSRDIVVRGHSSSILNRAVAWVSRHGAASYAAQDGNASTESGQGSMTILGTEFIGRISRTEAAAMCSGRCQLTVQAGFVYRDEVGVRYSSEARQIIEL